MVGRKGNVGSLWWIENDFFPIDTTYYVGTKLPLGFAYRLLETVEFIDSHAAVPGLSRDQAYGLPVAIPPAALMRDYDAVHREMQSQKEACRVTNVRLAATRDLLLPRLITGKLDISDIDFGDLLGEEAA